jgi:hypothetical protein
MPASGVYSTTSAERQFIGNRACTSAESARVRRMTTRIESRSRYVFVAAPWIVLDPKKVKRLKEVGADIVIDTSENPEWGKGVLDATSGRGAVLVVETRGADTIEQSMRAVSIHGQIMRLIARGMNKPDIQISAEA